MAHKKTRAKKTSKKTVKKTVLKYAKAMGKLDYLAKGRAVLAAKRGGKKVKWKSTGSSKTAGMGGQIPLDILERRLAKLTHYLEKR
jgi:hypothetical protein